MKTKGCSGEASLHPHCILTEPSCPEGKGREGKRKGRDLFPTPSFLPHRRRSPFWIWVESMIEEHDIERIAAAMNQLRPDWPVPSLRSFIRKNLATRARRDVCVAMAWVACEVGTATPARVLENGPWWKAAGVTGELTPRHATPGSCCDICGREMHAPDLICAKPARHTRNDDGPPSDYTAHAAAARTQLLGDTP